MPLTFGTAGIRGPLGPGPDAINLDTIGRASQGIGAYLSGRLGGRAARVVVGYDARRGSDDFALEAVERMADAGHESLVLPRPLPTPVLAYAVRALDTDAGIMITASHNPASDNGLKLYLGGRMTDEAGRGAQIASPTDSEIEALIAQAPSPAPPTRRGSIAALDDGVEERYVDAVAGLVPPPVEPVADRRAGLRIVLTPLHGVGGSTAGSVLAAAGFHSIDFVPEQQEPDPSFPTTPFPHPEEPGALDRAFARASATRADLVIALDPDADRCAVGFARDGRWTMLTGDEWGCLLGDRIADRLSSGEALPGVGSGARTLATTVVSSRRLEAIAARHGLHSVTTLTGFKWLSRVPDLAYAYEEALGYAVAPEIVRDKDGISAALAAAEFASLLKASGRDLGDALDELDATYGVHLTRQVSVRTSSARDASLAASRIASSPPRTLGGSPVVSVEDGRDGLDGLPPSLLVRMTTAPGGRVMVRPSGTESKVKAYLEVVGKPGAGSAGERRGLGEALNALADDVEEALEDAPPGATTP